MFVFFCNSETSLENRAILTSRDAKLRRGVMAQNMGYADTHPTDGTHESMGLY